MQDEKTPEYQAWELENQPVRHRTADGKVLVIAIRIEDERAAKPQRPVCFASFVQYLLLSMLQGLLLGLLFWLIALWMWSVVTSSLLAWLEAWYQEQEGVQEGLRLHQPPLTIM